MNSNVKPIYYHELLVENKSFQKFFPGYDNTNSKNNIIIILFLKYINILSLNAELNCK